MSDSNTLTNSRTWRCIYCGGLEESPLHQDLPFDGCPEAEEHVYETVTEAELQ